MKGELICVMLVVAMVHMKVEAVAVDCGQVQSNLSNCFLYLTGKAAKPTPACCNGVRRTKAMLATTVQRRQACECLKKAVVNNKNIKDAAARDLPTKCNVQLTVTISRSVNCNTIP